MTNRIPDSSALDDEVISTEEQRLGGLFELADQLAGDRVAQDVFLQSLTEADRQEIVAALVHANALRIMGSETVPAMKGLARQRLQEAIKAKSGDRIDPDSTKSKEWPVTDSIAPMTTPKNQ